MSIIETMDRDSFHGRKAERTRLYLLNHGQKITCTACGGSGRYDHNGSPKCGACGGTGKIRKESLDDRS